MILARRSIFAACLLVTGGATSVLAGGGFGYPSAPVVQVPAPIPIPDYANTFYLRGDFGWALYETPNIGDATTSYTNDDMGDAFSLGAGFGYNFRDTIRGDITVDYRSDTDVSATNAVTTHRTDLSSVAVLANVYYDFQGRNRLTPYVGGGIGFAYNETDNHMINGGGGTSGHGQAEFAGALMAGFSYRMNDSWLLDAGYRYLFLGDAKTESTATTNGLKIEDIRAHELRFGFRREFQ
ncbi:MAG: outer membrane protein [Alphaproteobacteria bacterium]